jgi:tetratricopeptide (TPR) repeat protein
MTTGRRASLLFLALVPLVLVGACAPEVAQRNDAGNRHFVRGEYNRALTEYHLAQAQDPDRAELYYNAANAYNRQQQLAPTINQSQRALTGADADLAARTWYNLGNALFDAQAWADAVAAYQEALRNDPHDLDAKHNLELALRYLKKQQAEAALSVPPEPEETGPTGEAAATLTAESGSQASQGATSSTATRDPYSELDSVGGDGIEGSPMTPEQALELLRALAEINTSVQAHLGSRLDVPLPAPQQDW